MNRSDELRAIILKLTAEYYREAFLTKEFSAGISSVPVSGRVFDERDLHRRWLVVHLISG